MVWFDLHIYTERTKTGFFFFLKWKTCDSTEMYSGIYRTPLPEDWDVTSRWLPILITQEALCGPQMI